MKYLNLIGEGSQLKSIILDKYELNEFAELVGLYPQSLGNYLKRSKINSKSFKKKISSIFETEYSMLIEIWDEQIKKTVYNIRENIIRYDKKEDNELFKELLKVTREYERYYIIALSCYARYKQNIGECDQAINIMKISIRIASQSEYADLELYNSFDLSFMFYQRGNYCKAYNCLINKKTNKLLSICEKMRYDYSLYKHYYFKGILLKNLDKYDKSREEFKRAKKYTNEESQLSKIYINIGITYKLQQRYDIAIKNYEKALKYSNKETEYAIYNNIAEALMMEGKELRAKINILTAIEKMPQNTPGLMKLEVYDIYFKILSKNSEETVIEKIKETLNKEYIDNKSLIIRIIRNIINCCKTNKNMVYLTMTEIVENLILKEKDTIFLNELRIIHSELIMLTKR